MHLHCCTSCKITAQIDFKKDPVFGVPQIFSQLKSCFLCDLSPMQNFTTLGQPLLGEKYLDRRVKEMPLIAATTFWLQRNAPTLLVPKINQSPPLPKKKRCVNQC
jgi:hypothetical protein